MAPWIIWKDISATYWETDQNQDPYCVAFLRNVVMSFLPLFCLFESIVPLSFDSPAETEYRTGVVGEGYVK